MTLRIKSLEEENETFQQSIMIKEEEVLELARTIKEKELKLNEIQSSSEMQSDQKSQLIEQKIK